ncbi:MAG: hypothetical protein L3K07_06220 [Thermoplasmata archaeon]|nr:hypothetical protein [Thermoplasmata archaeon]
MSGVPMCSWEGVGPDGEDRIVSCDKPATVVIEGEDGHRVFSCDEHLGEVHSKAGGGTVRRGAQHLHDEGKPRVSPESAVHWE